jgi:hypothetical protein
MTEQIYGNASGDTMTPIEHQHDDAADSREDGRGDATMSTEGDTEMLFDGDDAVTFRERWQQVQSRFVDDPRGAVADADSLVSDVTQSLTSRFAEQRTGLEQQWSQGENVETEDLRQTMQRYRTLFERLLAA